MATASRPFVRKSTGLEWTRSPINAILVSNIGINIKLHYKELPPG